MKIFASKLFGNHISGVSFGVYNNVGHYKKELSPDEIVNIPLVFEDEEDCFIPEQKKSSAEYSDAGRFIPGSIKNRPIGETWRKAKEVIKDPRTILSTGMGYVAAQSPEDLKNKAKNIIASAAEVRDEFKEKFMNNKDDVLAKYDKTSPDSAGGNENSAVDNNINNDDTNNSVSEREDLDNQDNSDAIDNTNTDETTDDTAQKADDEFVPESDTPDLDADDYDTDTDSCSDDVDAGEWFDW